MISMIYQNPIKQLEIVAYSQTRLDLWRKICYISKICLSEAVRALAGGRPGHHLGAEVSDVLRKPGVLGNLVACELQQLVRRGVVLVLEHQHERLVALEVSNGHGLGSRDPLFVVLLETAGEERHHLFPVLFPELGSLLGGLLAENGKDTEGVGLYPHFFHVVEK